jgi:uncharacterized protein (TIGR00290 family)
VAAIFIYPAANVPTQNGLPKALLSWSSGKDSAWALHVLRERGDVQVVGLLTTVNEAFQRAAMHAVRIELLRAQAEAVGLPLWEIEIPYPCSNEQYERGMSQAMAHARREGISSVAFGDLSLEDVRRYREDRMRGTGVEPIFPLWGQPTRDLSRAMLSAGMKAQFTCVDPKQVPATFAGRAYDQGALDELPATADPCGEGGEFHTFVYDGPMFSWPIPVQTGEVVERDGFVFADMIPAQIEAGQP